MTTTTAAAAAATHRVSNACRDGAARSSSPRHQRRPLEAPRAVLEPAMTARLPASPERIKLLRALPTCCCQLGKIGPACGGGRLTVAHCDWWRTRHWRQRLGPLWVAYIWACPAAGRGRCSCRSMMRRAMSRVGAKVKEGRGVRDRGAVAWLGDTADRGAADELSQRSRFVWLWYVLAPRMLHSGRVS